MGKMGKWEMEPLETDDFKEYATLDARPRSPVFGLGRGNQQPTLAPTPDAPTIPGGPSAPARSFYLNVNTTDATGKRKTLRVSGQPERSSSSDRSTNGQPEPTPINCYDIELAAIQKQFEKWYAKRAALLWVTDPERYNSLGGDKFRLDRAEFDAIEQSTGVATDGKLLWVTINPDFPGPVTKQHIDLMFERLTRLLQFKWVKSFDLCFEQRGLAPAPLTGLHVHMLLDRGKEVPSHCERDIQRVFLGICGNEKHINIMKINPTLKLQKIRYMQGQKNPPEPEKAENDQLMRKTFNLEDIYNENNFNAPPSPAHSSERDEEKEEDVEEHQEEDDNSEEAVEEY